MSRSSFKSSSSSFGSSSLTGSKFSSSSKTSSRNRKKTDEKEDVAMTFGVRLKPTSKKKPPTTNTSTSASTSTTTKSSTSVSKSTATKTSTTKSSSTTAKTSTSIPTSTPAIKTTIPNSTSTDQRILKLKSTRINIDQEKIPDFAVVRPRILPVLKPQSWERSTKDMLKKVDPKKAADVLYFPVKTLPDSALGYTLAIVNEEGSMHYILRSYLDEWNIPERVLMNVAIRNLEHRLENRGTRLWKRSKAGVYYLDNLGAVSASVILLPQFLDGLDIEEGDPIVVAPSGDICLVGGAKSDTQLCIMGEIALHFSKDPQRFEIKPLRFSKNRFHDYSPKTYAKEQNVPQTQDEVKTIRLRLKPLKINRQK